MPPARAELRPSPSACVDTACVDMLDCVTIFSKGGALLWRQAYTALKGDPINEVIKSVLLEV